MRWVPSKYNVITPSVLDRFMLVFNGRTGSLLEIDADTRDGVKAVLQGTLDAESLNAATRDRLVDAGVIVDVNADELALIEQRWAQRQRSGSLLFTVAPTMQCNFRCTYCFEEHRQEFMSPEVTQATIRFMLERMAYAHDISVTWFGGEPLLHVDCIEAIERAVRGAAEVAGIPTARSLVTNGYLLTDATIARLVALGPWAGIQVTVDGTPIQHDGRRTLAGGQGTWARVVRNCAAALDAGLPLTIRMNIDARNIDVLEEALEMLLDAGVLPRAGVYLGFVRDYTAECSHVTDVMIDKEAQAAAKLHLWRLLASRGLRTGMALPAPICGPFCTADSENGHVISPRGLVFKCWNEVHLPANAAVGTVVPSDTIPNAERNAQRWRSYRPLARSLCRECQALPVCMGGCPWEAMRQVEQTRGDCGSFRFAPEKHVAVAHAEMLIDAQISKAHEESS